jgi:hypothetical protein
VVEDMIERAGVCYAVGAIMEPYVRTTGQDERCLSDLPRIDAGQRDLVIAVADDSAFG